MQSRQPSIAVFGTVFIDCKGFAQQHYVPTGRNLGSIEFVHGGVGRNVAESLGHLQVKTALVSTTENSGIGQEVLDRLEQINVITKHVPKAERGMGMWLAILNESGDLAGSISQMPDLTRFMRLVEEEGEAIVQAYSHIALELDLNETISRQVLKHARSHNKKVYGIPGNFDVITRYPELLDLLDCFICNHIEAGRLLKLDLETMETGEILAALQAYIDARPLPAMIITLGEKGSVYYDCRTKEAGFQPAFPVKLVDTTGAGDAFFSGTVMGLVRGMSLANAVICGTKVAGWTIESAESTCPGLTARMQQDKAFQTLIASV